MRAKDQSGYLLGFLVFAAAVLLLVAIGGQRRFAVEELLSHPDHPSRAFPTRLLPNATSSPEGGELDLPKIFGDIDAAVASFRPGSRVFIVPTEMRVGNTEHVIV